MSNCHNAVFPKKKIYITQTFKQDPEQYIYRSDENFKIYYDQ